MNAVFYKTLHAAAVFAALAALAGCNQGPKLVPIEGQVV